MVCLTDEPELAEQVGAVVLVTPPALEPGAGQLAETVPVLVDDMAHLVEDLLGTGQAGHAVGEDDLVVEGPVDVTEPLVVLAAAVPLGVGGVTGLPEDTVDCGRRLLVGTEGLPEPQGGVIVRLRQREGEVIGENGRVLPCVQRVLDGGIGDGDLRRRPGVQIAGLAGVDHSASGPQTDAHLGIETLADVVDDGLDTTGRVLGLFLCGRTGCLGGRALQRGLFTVRRALGRGTRVQGLDEDSDTEDQQQNGTEGPQTRGAAPALPVSSVCSVFVPTCHPTTIEHQPVDVHRSRKTLVSRWFPHRGRR